jgi:hypothetical protein
MRSLSDLNEAVKEGAVQRIRPKIMTVSAILFPKGGSVSTQDNHNRMSTTPMTRNSAAVRRIGVS